MLAQPDAPFYMSVGLGTGHAVEEAVLIPSIAFGYGAWGGGLRGEVGAEYVRAARRRYPSGQNDFVARHGRLTASLAYAVLIGDRFEADLGLRALAGLDVLTRVCKDATPCRDGEGYSAAGPAVGVTALFGQVGVRASGGYAWGSTEEVYGGAWARVGLRYWP